MHIPIESVGGWVVLITGLHEEATESDVIEAIEDYGEIKNIHLNLDRQTGYAKGYALAEFSEKKNAEAAIRGLRGAKILGKEVQADWAFMKPPKKLDK